MKVLDRLKGFDKVKDTEEFLQILTTDCFVGERERLLEENKDPRAKLDEKKLLSVVEILVKYGLLEATHVLTGTEPTDPNVSWDSIKDLAGPIYCYVLVKCDIWIEDLQKKPLTLEQLECALAIEYVRQKKEGGPLKAEALHRFYESIESDLSGK
jgi:hypothetical protein